MIDLTAYITRAREAKRRADRAEGGPWGYMRPTREGGDVVFACPPGVGQFSGGVRGIRGRDVCTLGLPIGNPSTEFIAQARTDVPALADAVIALVAEVKRLKEVQK